MTLDGLIENLTNPGEYTAEQRVEVAADVIEWLDAGKLAVTVGNYVADIGKFHEEDKPIVADQELQPHIPEILPRCEVCARGALFLAAVGKYNNCRTREIIYTMGSLTGLAVTKTRQWFGTRQATMIEAAFEQWPWYPHGIMRPNAPENFITKRTHARCRGFSIDPRPHSRLRMICANMVANRGYFRP